MPPPGVCLNIMKERHKKDGRGSLANPLKFLNQDFEQMKQYCIAREVRFVDDMFPPDHNSIGDGLLSPSDMARVVWLRPHVSYKGVRGLSAGRLAAKNEVVSLGKALHPTCLRGNVPVLAKIAPNPSFVVDGVSRFDFGQGIVGNCWFLASIGALTFQKHILHQVMPLDQWFEKEYCGVFHFRFWRFGKWEDVLIDDKLPTIDGRLIFVHSKTPNEFWPALMEKAYAKVCGSYADMNAGTPSEALVDFTGGIHLCIKLKEAPANLWDLMSRAAKSKSLMGCGTPQGETSANTIAENGLVRGHAYTVTGVFQLMRNGRAVNLVRLWNPWGEVEWKGDWSDKSPLWQTVSPEERLKCVSVKDDGEFWMTIEDFCSHYSDLDICSLCPDFLDGNSSCHWGCSIHEGRWVAGTTAGGCLNYRDSFWTNPQYRLKIEGLDEDCAETQGDKNMLVSLMQKPDKRNRRLVKSLHIGFSIFVVPEQYKRLKGKFPASFFATNTPVAQSKNYLNAREVMELFWLKPGEYLVVPSTFKPDETASFILSILSKSETDMHENSDGHDHMEENISKPKTMENEDNENKKTIFRQYSDQFQEVDAELLQKILNDNILKGQTNNGGFSLDSCRSMVALMDTSITGKLNSAEFLRLVRKVTTFKEIFFATDVSRTGTLSLSELRNAVMASGMMVSDGMLNLMAVRYGGSSGNISLESFISLAIRLDCMAKIFRQLSEGSVMSLQESEWMYISMYT